LRLIANQRFGINCSIAHGGIVGRAENRALVRYLDLNLRPVHEADVTKFDLIAMVDTQPGTGNNSLPEGVPVDIVIDHHPIRRATRSAQFTDIRRQYGATSTILFEYLTAFKVQPEASLATALCYAIRSDTQDLGRESTKADMDAYMALYPLANKRMLGRIQFAPEPVEYFRSLRTALEKAVVYGRCVVAALGPVDWPDTVAELADLLLRYEGAAWALTCGIHNGIMHLSLRCNEPERDAGRMMRSLVADLGTGGGHATVAGGQVPLPDPSDERRLEIERTVLRRLLRRLHVRRTEGHPLLSES
jgi:nanoRNase/pAp phosphatase (c-di-AMP/oligoRNAs hydrolase)